MVGNLAESWEITLPDTVKYHIRQGIHWQDKAPTYGMAFTAEDVAWPWNFYWRSGSTYNTKYPWLSDMENSDSVPANAGGRWNSLILN